MKTDAKNFMLKSLLFLATLISGTPSLKAECIGKIDLGAVFLHVDVLESNKTIKAVNMPGVRADASILIWKGLCLKPSILYAQNGNTDTLTGGCGLGFYIKLDDQFCITPSLGCNFTEFNTTIKYPITEFFSLNLKERFRSVSPYGALEATFTFVPGWRATILGQYVISRTHTKITDFGSTTSRPKGPNYALILEADINEHWSINIAGAYNLSLTKEKHGLRAYGGRLAVAYWF